MSQADVFCGRDGFSIDEKEIEEILVCLKKDMPWAFPAGTLSIAFLGDDETCRMHDEFLSDPSKTDVITFPGDAVFSTPQLRNSAPAQDSENDGDETLFAGEICICVDQALRMAHELKTMPQDELLLYLVHGWLHLAGLDDIEEIDRSAMRSAETLALDLLRKKELAPLKTAVFPR